MRTRRVAALFVAVPVVLATPLAAAAPAPHPDVPVADVATGTWCTPTDPALDELSGLAVSGGRLFATPDAGGDESVVELGPDCEVVRRLPPPVDPYDVEDLAVGPDGRLWLADLGDNTARRETVALISLDPDTGTGSLHRLTYPDGPRDAEALLLSAEGVPYLVTKALFGPGEVYRPARGRTVADLAEPGPSPLERVGALDPGPTDTPGGPLPGASSSLITGGAVSADGTVAAIRTYTDVYLFHAPDRDLGAALQAGPRLRLPVPDEPQGEAVAFTADGDLLTGSETTAAGPRPPIRVWRGVTGLFAAPDPQPAAPAAASRTTVITGAVVATVVTLAVVGAALVRRGRR